MKEELNEQNHHTKKRNKERDSVNLASFCMEQEAKSGTISSGYRKGRQYLNIVKIILYPAPITTFTVPLTFETPIRFR